MHSHANIGSFSVVKLTRFHRKSFYQIEAPLAFLLAAMEVVGVGFLPSRLSDMEKELEKQCELLSDEVKAISGDADFNIRSPQQVADLLFVKLKIKPGVSNPYKAQQKKTDQLSTGGEARQ